MGNFEQTLKAIGGFGLFQKRLLAALFIPYLFVGLDMTSLVFAVLSFPHHCNTDWILERAPNLTEDRRRNLTLPVREDGSFESCEMFTPVDLDLETIEKYGINATTGCVNGTEFEKPKEATSIVTDFDLVCGRSGLVEVSQSIELAGLSVGAFVMGQVSDREFAFVFVVVSLCRCGRRFVFLLSLLILLLFNVGCGFIPNVYVYTAFRFISAFFISGLSMNIIVLGTEWSESSKSAFCTNTCLCSFPLGLMILSGVAYFIRNWRILQMVLFSPFVIILGTYYWFVPESARWLVTQGRKEEAKLLIRRAAKVNGRSVPEDLLDRLEADAPPPKQWTLLDVFRVAYLRKRVIIMSCAWFAVTLMYFGLTLNVGGFGLSVYLAQFIFALVEIPAYLGNVTVLQRVGRRVCQAGTLIFGGLTCLGILFTPTDLPTVVTVLAVLGKFVATASFATAFVYSAELFPTIVRQNCVGLSAAFSRLGGILAPLVGLLEVYHHTIPMLIYGTLPIVAGGLCFLLPETRNLELQDYAEPERLNNELPDSREPSVKNHPEKSTKL